MADQVHLPSTHPIVTAWVEYNTRSEIVTLLREAMMYPQTVHGAAWDAFVAGFTAGQKLAQAVSAGAPKLSQNSEPDYQHLSLEEVPGTRVYFVWPTNGYPSDKDQAKRLALIRYHGYTLQKLEVHSSHSYILLEEFPGEVFNSVQFGLHKSHE